MTDKSNKISYTKLIKYPEEETLKNVLNWRRQFIAVALTRGYRDILTGDVKVERNSDDLVKGLNTVGYSDLILVTAHNAKATRTVTTAITNDFKGGHLPTAWNKLIKRTIPLTTASKAKINATFNELTLDSSDQDPEEWIAELEDYQLILVQFFNKTVEESQKDIKGHIFTKIAIDNYDTVLKPLEKRHDKNDDVELDEIIEDMKQHFDLMQEREKTEGVDRGMFCGQVGKGTQVNAVGIAKFKGTCNKCGKQGHKSKDCWENEANADKRPANWRPGTRQIGGRRNGGGSNNNGGGQGYQRKCYKCGSTDHIRRNCPQLARNQTNNVNNANTGGDDSSSSSSEFCLMVQQNWEFDLEPEIPDEIDVQVEDSMEIEFYLEEEENESFDVFESCWNAENNFCGANTTVKKTDLPNVWGCGFRCNGAH
jgi:hypothetical protein